MDLKTIIIMFSLGWLFWYFSDHLADYNDYPSYNFTLYIFCLFMTTIIIKNFNIGTYSSIFAFIFGQQCYLIYDYIYNGEDSMLTYKSLYYGLLAVGLSTASAYAIINKF